MSFSVKVFATFLILSCNVIAQETPSLKKVYLENENEYVWTSANYPNAYPPDASEDLLVTTDTGYSIKVVIESLNIDGFGGDLLIMKPGSSLEGKDKGKIFTFSLKSERKYTVHTDSVYFSFKVVSNNTEKTGFKVRFKRFGEIVVTTTHIPTTVITWPTPSGSESIHYSGYIHGKNKDEFNGSLPLQANLKTAISNMASKYCEYNNIVTTEPITTQNVIINQLMECPNTWPDSNVCVKLRFAVPIIYQENEVWKGYQLNEDNLSLMWTKYANEHLKGYGMKIYEKPDDRFVFRKWVIIFCLILFVFLIALMLLKIALRYTSSTNRKKRLSDVGILSQEPRTNKISLTPHPNQVTPPLFDSDYTFNTYDPDDAISKRTYNSSMGNQNFSYVESEDDDSDIDIYDNQHFSNSAHSKVETKTKESDI